MTRLRIRRSTLVLCAFFLLTLAVYLLVRPDTVAQVGGPAQTPAAPPPTRPAPSRPPPGRPPRRPAITRQPLLRATARRRPRLRPPPLSAARPARPRPLPAPRSRRRRRQPSRTAARKYVPERSVRGPAVPGVLILGRGHQTEEVADDAAAPGGEDRLAWNCSPPAGCRVCRSPIGIPPGPRAVIASLPRLTFAIIYLDCLDLKGIHELARFRRPSSVSASSSARRTLRDRRLSPVMGRR